MIEKEREKLGIIFGIRNISNNELSLQLKLKGYFIINPKEWDYKKEKCEFTIKQSEEKIICIRKISGINNATYKFL